MRNLHKRGWVRMAALMSVVGALSVGVWGCAEQTGREVDPDTRLIGDRGLQSRDLREMTTQMAPQIVERFAANPTMTVVVMKDVENRTATYRGQDLTIFVHKLRTLLNSSQTRDKFLFVEKRATTERLQGEELGSGDPYGEAGRADAPDSRLLPQYALKGVIEELPGARSSYFLCTFQMTDIATGAIAWEGKYEVTTLN